MSAPPPREAVTAVAVFRRLWSLLRGRDRAWLAAGLASALVSTLSGIALLAVSGHFITAMALAGLGGVVINYYTPAALIRLFAILRTVGRYLERLVTHEATLRVLAQLRTWVFARLVPLAPARLGGLRSAQLFARLRADVDALEHAYLGVALPLAVAAVVAAVTTMVVGLYLPLLGLVALVLFAIVGGWLPARLLRRGAAAGNEVVACTETLRALAVDGLRGRTELALYGAEAAHAERVASMQARLRAARAHIDGQQGLGAAAVALAAQLGVVATLALGLPKLAGTALAGPDLVMLALLLPGAFEAIAPLPEAWAMLGVTLASARRVFGLADTAPAVSEPARPAAVPEGTALAMRGLCLRYSGATGWALDGVDLDLPHACRLAVVGPSGAGKSSLAAALLKLYPYQGSIRLGGVSLDDWRGDDLRARIAVVDQQPYLFDASLRSNLLLARPDATDAMLHDVLEQAQLTGYVAGLPRGLDTWVGENGVRVSGGEARRIAVARALLADAPILLLDEPTEGLDAETARSLYRALDVAMAGRSVLLITHRLGGLAALVDAVAVMRDGRIVEQVPVATYLAKDMASLVAPDVRTSV